MRNRDYDIDDCEEIIRQREERSQRRYENDGCQESDSGVPISLHKNLSQSQ